MFIDQIESEVLKTLTWNGVKDLSRDYSLVVFDFFLIFFVFFFDFFLIFF